MDCFVVRGGRPLYGTVPVGGSKNAALPLLFATLVTNGVSRIRGVPDIDDVHAALTILRAFGAVISHPSDGVYTIDTEHVRYTIPPETAVRSIRASTYLLGASLARFGRVRIQPFGGCAFSDRPIDMHLDAARALGAQVGTLDITAKECLVGGHIVFPKVSVGATVNALLLASTARGETIIENPAVEPHVTALAEYLRDTGADITFGDGRITVRGASLHGADATVIPDMIEAGTYLLAGLVTGGAVTVDGVITDHLRALSELLRAAGVVVREGEMSVFATAPRRLSAMAVTAAPYPAFPTDLQPLMAPLLAVCRGGTLADTVFPERFGYLEALSSFGVVSERRYGSASVFPSVLRPACATVPDLRGGASLLLCALAAEGESRISESSVLYRGYEKPVEKFRALGADICEI